MFTNIMYINLIVSDQDKALAFYTQLGFDKRIDYPGPENRFLTVGFKGQDVELILMKGVTDTTDQLTDVNDAQNPGFLFIESVDLREACRALAAGGVTFETEPVDYPWGVRATVLDPDGNRVELRQRR